MKIRRSAQLFARCGLILLVVLGCVTRSEAVVPATFAWLGTLPGDIISDASDVSADGSTVVGYSYQNETTTHAIRWTAAGGMVSIGDLPGGNTNGAANAVSANGGVIVGGSSSALSYSGNPGYQEPFRWTASTGMQGFGYLSNYPSSYGGAYGVSADGSVVVGNSSDS